MSHQKTINRNLIFKNLEMVCFDNNFNTMVGYGTLKGGTYQHKMFAPEYHMPFKHQYLLKHTSSNNYDGIGYGNWGSLTRMIQKVGPRALSATKNLAEQALKVGEKIGQQVLKTAAKAATSETGKILMKNVSDRAAEKISEALKQRAKKEKNPFKRDLKERMAIVADNEIRKGINTSREKILNKLNSYTDGRDLQGKGSDFKRKKSLQKKQSSLMKKGIINPGLMVFNPVN